jgi:hypothetical protein
MAGHTSAARWITGAEAGIFDLVAISTFHAEPDVEFVAKGQRLLGWRRGLERLGFAVGDGCLGVEKAGEDEGGAKDGQAAVHAARLRFL